MTQTTTWDPEQYRRYGDERSRSFSESVDSPNGYFALLADAGFDTDVWDTTYIHALRGPNPVLEWVRGTGLRPVLTALSAEDASEFESEYGALLASAYPSRDGVTAFGFRRVFCVGRKG